MSFTLEGFGDAIGRIPFLGMRIESLREVGCAPLAGRLREYLPWPRYYSIQAGLFLKRWPRLTPDLPPLRVTVSSTDPRLTLTVSGDSPWSFRSTVPSRSG